MMKLGRGNEAKAIFQGLTNVGGNVVTVDPSASANEQQSARQRIAQQHYLAGMGYLALGMNDKAKVELSAALEVAPDCLGAREAMTNLH